MSAAYRWYLGYGLSEKLPNYSTFSKNYERRFAGGSLFEQIFARVWDAGFKTLAIAREILEDKRTPVMPYKRPMPKEGYYKSQISHTMNTTIAISALKTLY